MFATVSGLRRCMYALRPRRPSRKHLRNCPRGGQPSSMSDTAAEVRVMRTAEMTISRHDGSHPCSESPTSRIGEGTKLSNLVEIGNYSDVGSNVTLMRNVTVGDFTTIGDGTTVFPNAILGALPQDRKYGGGDTRLVIGKNCVIREGVQVERGTEDGGGLTVVKESTLIMSGAYIGHDCQVEESVVVANNVSLAGHCHLYRGCVIGGHAGLHQHVRVGAHAMVGGMAGIRRDVLPYTVVSGASPSLRSLNFHHLWPKLGFIGRRTAIYCFHALFKKGGWRALSDLLPTASLPTTPSLAERLEALSAVDIGLLMSACACQVGKMQIEGSSLEEIKLLQNVFRDIAEFALSSSRRGLYCEA